MNIWMILIAMIFCHILDDFILQALSPLASMKQRKWWKENYPQELYKYDYVVGLLVHAFSWSFMIMLPIFVATAWNPPGYLLLWGLLNVIIHAAVDDQKANRFRINLIQDQGFHLLQIVVTWILWVCMP